MKFYIRIVRHKSITYDIQPQIDLLVSWLRRHTPLEPIVARDVFDDSVSFKDFGTIWGYWGLDGIKRQLRWHLPNESDHVVIFLYDRAGIHKPLAAWTYGNSFNGAAFVEIPCDEVGAKTYDIARMLTHEICHAFHRLCWFKGIPTQDTMDLYDKDGEADAPDGNRARNLRAVSMYWPVIARPPIWWLLESIKTSLLEIRATLGRMMKPFDVWASAMKEYEGWGGPGSIVSGRVYPTGTPSFRNNNPGNLKFAGQRGAVKAPDSDFAKFLTYEAGWAALIHQLTIAVDGRSSSFNPTMTLLEFFAVYAPSKDNNDPNAYALFVARKLGVPPTTPIGQIAGKVEPT